MLWDNFLLEDTPEAEWLLSGGCLCLVTGSLGLGLIHLAEQALLGLLAEMRIDLDKTNYQRVEGLEIGSEVVALDVVAEILVPFQHLDHNTCHDIVDCPEKEAMGEEDITVGEEVHSMVVVRSPEG